MPGTDPPLAFIVKHVAKRMLQQIIFIYDGDGLVQFPAIPAVECCKAAVSEIMFLSNRWGQARNIALENQSLDLFAFIIMLEKHLSDTFQIAVIMAVNAFILMFRKH
jgi:hypothetical protein